MARENILTMRCTDRELDHLTVLARERGVSRSELVRWALTTALMAEGAPGPNTPDDNASTELVPV